MPCAACCGESGNRPGRLGVAGWRQWCKLSRGVRSRLHAVRQTHRAKARGVVDCLHTCRPLVARAKSSLKALEKAGPIASKSKEIKGLRGHAERQVDQSDRWLLQGQTIPHEEKVFFIFEPHTRWISKGKAGCPVELGGPVSVVKDQDRFLLHHQVLWEGSDVDVAVPIIEQMQELFPNLRACSFDRNFHSPENRIQLNQLLDLNALPDKGKSDDFRQARQQHPAVEAGVNHLDQHGLDRVRTRGKAGFERTVALAVLGTNLHRLGRVLQPAER